MRWTGIRRVSLQCENDCQLQFGMEVPTFTPLNINKNNDIMNTIISRGICTVPLTLIIPIMSTTTATDALATTEIIDTTEISTTNTEAVDTQSQTGAMATTEIPATITSAEILEDNILEHIKEAPIFNRIRALVSVVGS